MHVIKRDGRKEKFEQTKIENAINKCLKQCNYLDDKLAKLIVSSINRKIKDLNEIEVEKIQDLVEDELIHRDLKELAKSYIKYRHDRSNARQFKSSLTQIFHEINSTNSDDMDLKRENANIDANTSMGTMLKYGSEAAKDYNLKYLIKPEYAQAHINGDLHLHDLDFYSITLNCLFIPLAKLLKNGFNTGHGSIRPPQSIQSASSLACIILQSNQNEMFGGQAFPTFDYDLAPYVAKSFIKNLSNCLKFDGFDNKYHCNLKSLNEKLEDFYNVHNTIIENKDDICKIIQNSTEFFDEIEDGVECRNDFIKCYDYAYEKTNKDTYQAMESLIHNANTLHSRAGAQVPFSSINYGTCTTPEGRMIVENVLSATEAGLGHGETPIFPVQIFKMKKGINWYPEDPNYDLMKHAIKCSAKRLFPNFTYVDAPYNLQYYKEGKPETEIAVMGCCAGYETITYRYNDTIYDNVSFETAFDHLKSIFNVYYENEASEYVKLSNVEILDNGKFTLCKGILRNKNVSNWVEVVTEKGKKLRLTDDHPLILKNKGRTQIKDAFVGDYIFD